MNWKASPHERQTHPSPMSRFAKAAVKNSDGMNKLEASYAALLELRRRAGEIRSFTFEAIKFRLAANTFYTPDFFVIAADGTCEIHETKGFWEEDARVKIKVFAELFPMFRVFGVTREKGNWKYEEFNK